MEITFSNEVGIESNIENVYAYLSKMENFSTWNYAVMSVEPVENGTNANYILKRDLGNKIETETVTVLETKLNQRLYFQANGGRFPYEMKYELQQSGNGTILTNAVILKPAGVNGIMLKLLKSNIQAEVNKNLNVLKHILESG